MGAVAVADLVKSTLGPKGMDKILQSMGRGQEVTVTNDGATILKSIHVDNPAARVLVGAWPRRRGAAAACCCAAARGSCGGVAPAWMR